MLLEHHGGSAGPTSWVLRCKAMKGLGLAVLLRLEYSRKVECNTTLSKFVNQDTQGKEARERERENA